MLKTCRKCGDTFDPCADGVNKFKGRWCRPCVRAHQRDYYHRNRELYAAFRQKYKAARQIPKGGEPVNRTVRRTFTGMVEQFVGQGYE